MKSALLFVFPFIFCLYAFSQVPGSGSAINLDGINDYVNIPNTAALNPTAAITVEAWIKADTWGVNPWSNSIVNKEGWALGSQGYTLRCGQNGKLSFNFGAAGSWHEAVSASLMTTGKWYHVAGTYDGSTIRIFINGEQVATQLYFGTMAVGSYDVRIGELAYSAGGSRPFDGQIDEVRIWNQSIPVGTLRQWMCKKVTSSHPSFAGLVGYWQMDAGTGNTVAGGAGTTISGTLTNGPTWVTSSAPIGDESKQQYNANPVGLIHPDGDSLSVETITGSPAGIHIYRIDQAPNVTTPPTGTTQLDNQRYWGVFTVGGTNPTFSVRYHYAGNPLATGACGLSLARRNNNAITSWTNLTAQNLTAVSQLLVTGTTPGEFILATQSPSVAIFPQSSLSFCQGDSVVLEGTTLAGATYQWLFNGDSIAGATDTILTASVSGSYSLQVDASGCITSAPPVSVVVNVPPSVLFDTLAAICLNASPIVLTTGFPAGGVYAGIGVNAGIFNPVAADTGIHVLNYYFTDSNGCTDSASQNIEVLPLPEVSQAPFDPLCALSQPVLLTGGMPVGGVYSGSGVNGQSFDPALVGPGQYLIAYTVTGANGCTNLANQMMTVYTNPAVSAGNDQTICEGSSATLIAAGGVSFLWSTGDTLQTLVVTPGQTTSYHVTVTDQNGCHNSDSVVVAIQPAPLADAGEDQTICEGETATLTAGGGISYSWSTGQTGDSIQVQPVTETSYSVTATDNLGCSGTDTVVVFVDPLPVVDFTYDQYGSQITFQNLSANGSQYLWDFGDGTPGDSSASPVHIYEFNGLYQVTLTISNNCGETDTTFFINITNTNLEENALRPHLSLFPNPANQSVFISVAGLQNQSFGLRLMDIQGKVLWENREKPGMENFTTELNLEKCAAGLYLIEVSGNEFLVTKRLILER
ncbi:MAG: LamG-like jellyroll fold domain-containing protein [Bacteroidia bacterium]|nr:LamG-like jellyroll fold domain-containing protein [Bacteroidia bacterium]